MSEPADAFPRTWVEFPDPADPQQLIRADLTWLTSRYECIYGRGCAGIDAALPYAGCCTHGAHFADKDDRARVAGWVQRLTERHWQGRPTAGKIRRRDWMTTDDDGEHKTRTVDGACVFLNRPDFPAGAGCALHVLAADLGESPIDTKPDVCWQLPIRRDFHWRQRNDDTEVLVITIGEYTRDVWGEGGHGFDWYCTSEPAAHGAAQPLYASSRAELVAMIGQPAYDQLAAHCAAHEAARDALRLTPVARGMTRHPADPEPHDR